MNQNQTLDPAARAQADIEAIANRLYMEAFCKKASALGRPITEEVVHDALEIAWMTGEHEEQAKTASVKEAARILREHLRPAQTESEKAAAEDARVSQAVSARLSADPAFAQHLRKAARDLLGAQAA